VTEAGLRGAPKAHGTVVTAGKSSLLQAVEVQDVVRAPSDRISSIEAMSKQEDWLDTATADPAFWLKGIN
jgi:hypothetical protein